jgi:predicted phage tail protein
MIKVYLHGKLGEKFKNEWSLDVATTREAMQAIDANTNSEFRKYLSKAENLDSRYVVIVDEEAISEDEFNVKNPSRELHIIPEVKGSGWLKKALKSIFGAVFIALSFIPGLQFLLPVGIGLLVAGVIDLLTKTPEIKESESTQSFLTQGVNSVYQGNPVPLGYGTLRVGSSNISTHQDNFPLDSYDPDKHSNLQIAEKMFYKYNTARQEKNEYLTETSQAYLAANIDQRGDSLNQFRSNITDYDSNLLSQLGSDSSWVQYRTYGNSDLTKNQYNYSNSVIWDSNGNFIGFSDSIQDL